MIDYSHCVDPQSSGGPPETPATTPVPSGNYQSNFKNGLTPAQAPAWSQQTATRLYYAGQVITECPSGATCHSVPNTKVCTLEFTIPDDVGPPTSSLLLYYRLTNFYQNHRRYVKSFDSGQLSGSASDAGTINSSSCDPLTSTFDKPYYPCGVVANSMFNDTFYSPKFLQGSIAQPYPMTNQGIAWSSDAKLYNQTSYDLSTIAVPPYWQERWPASGYSNANPPPNLKTYEEFQVWMRTAGLPAFSKLALRNDNQTMKSGRYSIEIDMSTWHPYLIVAPLISSRLPCDRVRRDKVNRAFHDHSDWRQEPFSGHCLRGCGRYLCVVGPRLHRVPARKTKVSATRLSKPAFSTILRPFLVLLLTAVGNSATTPTSPGIKSNPVRLLRLEFHGLVTTPHRR